MPGYEAVIECVPIPSVLVENTALPVPLSGAVPSTVELSRKVAIPAGIPVVLVTRAVNVAGLPARLEDAALKVVCVLVCCTVCVTTGELLAA